MDKQGRNVCAITERNSIAKRFNRSNDAVSGFEGPWKNQILMIFYLANKKKKTILMMRDRN